MAGAFSLRRSGEIVPVAFGVNHAIRRKDIRSRIGRRKTKEST